VLTELGVRPKADPEEALFQALVGAWSRANAKVKRRLRAHIGSGSEG
jgi:maltooligosyltrehalose synthase